MIYKFNELDSTNKYCLENYNELKQMDVVYALKQTFGRGRMGRSWESNDSIAMSIVLKDNLNFDLGKISFVAAASIYNVLKKYVSNLSIKWPNDLLVNDQKICGILCQSKIEDDAKCLVVGIGLNTNNESFDGELKQKATSLYILNNKKYKNILIIKKIYREFKRLYKLFLKGDTKYLSICKENNYLLNKEIEFIYENKPMSGKVLDINDSCELVIQTKEELICLKTGEVLLKKAYFF